MLRTATLFLFLVLALCLVPTSNADAHTIRQNVCDSNRKNLIADMQVSGSSPAAISDAGIMLIQHCSMWRNRHNLRHICAKPRRPLIERGFTLKGEIATLKQRQNLTRALNVGRKMRVGRKIQISLIIAIIQESTANNLPYGHGTSVGILQLINVHGSPSYRIDRAANIAWRMKVENSAGWYLRGVTKTGGTRYLTVGQIADRQQAPAVKGLYDKWIPEANIIYARYLSPCKM